MRTGGYTRLPVYEEKISNIVGIATLSPWEIMDGETRGRDLSEFTGAAHYVSVHQMVDQLLPLLHRGKTGWLSWSTSSALPSV